MVIIYVASEDGLALISHLGRGGHLVTGESCGRYSPPHLHMINRLLRRILSATFVTHLFE